MAYYLWNRDCNGIEIYFDTMPSEEIRTQLRENGWHWRKEKKCWFIQRTDSSLRFAKELCGEGLPSFSIEQVKKRYCYVSTVVDFLKTTQDAWISDMKTGFSDAFSLPLGGVQVAVWRDCYEVLKAALPEFEELHPNFYLIFEYSLPYQSERRPDVLLVSNEYVLILEFKKKRQALRVDIDQAAAYGRDIREYHFESRDKCVLTYLVLTQADKVNIFSESNVHICSGDLLTKTLCEAVEGQTTACNIEQWIQSRYEPLPTIVEAARMMMRREALPNIRRVNSTGIPEAIECLKSVTAYAQENKKHILAMVTGVPGAGKTFLGLQFVYDICEKNDRVNSVYLSGNGPLVRVLTDALRSNVFVKDLHKIIEEYLQRKAKDFSSNVIVFDEGQRAWDKTQMKNKNRGCDSEPDVMVRLAEERLDWCVLLVLVGEGQEIYTGESAGIGQWNDALKKSQLSWEVVCPDKVEPVFSGEQKLIGHAYRNKLDLTVSLRTHLAGDVSQFVNHLIAGEIHTASTYVEGIKAAGFTMLVTRDLEAAKEYCRERYRGQKSKRYGLIASSKEDRFMKSYGIDNSFQATSLRYLDIGKWFNTDASSGISCCNLEKVVTEFGCQGLELDLPIVCWGPDMKWNGSSWVLYRASQPKDSDDNVYRANSYRVLLTRGRDGFLVFVPNDASLDGVYQLFVQLNIDTLGEK